VQNYLRLRIKMHMSQLDALEQTTPFLFVGNNRYQTSGLTVGTRARLDSGQLWVCTSPHHHRGNLVRTALRALVGRHTDEALNAFETGEFTVQPETAKVDVSTDGEVTSMTAPLHFVARASVLPVIVPAAE
jgi:diacylglycerol kinase family enzyme